MTKNNSANKGTYNYFVKTIPLQHTNITMSASFYRPFRRLFRWLCRHRCHVFVDIVVIVVTSFSTFSSSSSRLCRHRCRRRHCRLCRRLCHVFVVIVIVIRFSGQHWLHFQHPLAENVKFNCSPLRKMRHRQRTDNTLFIHSRKKMRVFFIFKR